MISCKNCGRENEDEYKFCLGCGSALIRAMQPVAAASPAVSCPHCGSQLPGQFKFCGVCGGSVVQAAPEMAPIMATPAPYMSAMGMPEMAMPELAMPALAMPEFAMPELAMPELAMPGFAMPELAMPELAMPGFAMPEFAMPEPTFSQHSAGVAPGFGFGAPEFEPETYGSSAMAAFAQTPLPPAQQSPLGLAVDPAPVFSLPGIAIEPPPAVVAAPELLAVPDLEPLDPFGGAASFDQVRFDIQQPTPFPIVRARGTLTVVRPDGTDGEVIEIADGEQTLGRSSAVATLSSDPFLSPEHVGIQYEDGGFRVRDLGSLNGVFLRVTRPMELVDGDTIRVGQQLLRFELVESIAPINGPSPDGKTRVGGSPVEGVWGRLSVINGPTDISRAYVLSGDDVAIGREIGTMLFRDDGFVSGRHARVMRQDGRAILEDLGSSNGTYLRVREDGRVSNGELILMGQQLYRVAVF